MTRSNLMPESGRRFIFFKKISKITSISIFILILFSFVCYDAVFERISGVDAKDFIGPVATPDELNAGASELPDEYRSIFYENEYPIALGIYDTLFSVDPDAGNSDTVIPDGELKIVTMDLSKSPVNGAILLKNNTTYAISAADLLNADKMTIPTALTPASDKDAPKVLIIHTHGTESYADEGRISYKKSALPRSKDITKNVVAVGKTFADTLIKNGIPTLHCETMFDEKSFNNAYTYSKQAVLEYLKQYPSIEYVFDIHRDAVLTSTSAVKLLTYDGSTPVAQVMLVIGTNAGGADHPNWKTNLSFAVDTQYLLNKRLEKFARPICIKTASFNQQYSSGAMLLEIGTCVNTLAEANAAAEILGETLAGLILGRSNN